MVSNEQLRLLVRSLPEVEEQPHWDKTSFRTRKRIFATFSAEKRLAMLKLPLDDQEILTREQPEIYKCGGWSNQGWTEVDLERVEVGEFKALLVLAWRNIATKRAIQSYEGDETAQDEG